MDGCDLFLFIRFTRSDRYPEASESGQSERTTPAPEATPQPSMPPPPKVPPKVAPSKTTSASQQPGRYRKRPFAYTEDHSDGDDDNDVDMDNIEDNDSSGSSVDSNHVPAKRLRTSITTRGSKNTPTPESPTSEMNVPQSPPSTVDDRTPVVGSLDIGPKPGIPCSSSKDVDIDGRSANPETHDVASVDTHHIHEPVSPLPATPLQSHSPSPEPASDSESKIPDFLIGKHDIHGYLSSVDEPGFQVLLKNYITFELTNRSSIRGTFTTAYRPNAIGWWSGRARPDKLPPYDSLNSFTSSIVEWWTFVQPGWRKIKPRKITRTEGDWECLYQPGVNGLLNIVVLAHWWARILAERESPVDDMYSWFVADVTWVLSRLTAAARKGIY